MTNVVSALVTFMLATNLNVVGHPSGRLRIDITTVDQLEIVTYQTPSGESRCITNVFPVKTNIVFMRWTMQRGRPVWEPAPSLPPARFFPVQSGPPSPPGFFGQSINNTNSP